MYLLLANLERPCGRSWVGAVVCAVTAICVAGQKEVDPRLGLLATDLGIAPVPGGQPGGE